MCRFASWPGGWRRVAMLDSLFVLCLLLAGSAAEAQRLLRLVPGVESASSAGDGGSTMGPVPVAVDVDLALLRSAPFRLEAPTPEGGVMSAQRSVFEDRGNGDLMWSGGPPGAGYDTVVLTVEGGRFVGRFGSAGGAAYHIHAERDGRGGMAALGAPAIEDWCGADTGAEGEHEGHVHGPATSAANAARVAPPKAVSNPQSHDRLDILVTYSASAARNWADRGGPEAAIRHAGDYMKMVFRNNRLGVEPHIVHITPLPAALEYPGRERGWLRDLPKAYGLAYQDGDLRSLRHAHRADVVHIFTGESPFVLRACGIAQTLRRGWTAAFFSDWPSGLTSNHGLCGDYAAIFVHEVGHNLGANHEPAWNNQTEEERFRPYALGHVNRDIVPNVGSAMAYGGQTAPFFSTPRIDLHGAALGVADEQDNERTLQETVHIGVRYSDYLPSLEGAPPRPEGLRARLDGDVAHLSWQDNGRGTDEYVLVYMTPEFRSDGAFGTEYFSCCGGVDRRLESRSEAIVPLENPGPGTRHYFYLRAPSGAKVPLPSSMVRLIVPGEPAVAAPSDVSVEVAPDLNAVVFHWTDNSDDEVGFDVQLMRNGEPQERNTLRPDSEQGDIGRTGVGFGAYVSSEKEAGVDYGARVVAYNALGQAGASEEVAFRWEHPLATPPVSDLALFRTGPATVRARWSPDPGVRSYRVRASVGPVAFERRWERPRTGPVETAWLDFEGLARGGHYVFRAYSSRHDTKLAISMPSKVELTLGERGPGPQGPSALSGTVVRERRDSVDRYTRLSWEDNSADELGFVVQAGGDAFWLTEGVVSADTESFLAERTSRIDDFRVFAYNEHGYSLSSPRVDAALALDLVATAGDALVGLTWGVKDVSDYDGLQTPTGVQVRWRATADLPFRGPGDSWLDLPAGARGYAVTGLRNGREYTFEARPVTSVGVGVSWAATATPRSGLPAPPVRACPADQETLCLQGGRYEVTASWRDRDGWFGRARVVGEGTDDSGLFRFFDPMNWEILIKVLDGCRDNGHMWVLAASTTDLEYRIDVVDRVAGESRTYENELGRRAPAIVDTKAFSCEGHGGSG